MSSAAGIIKKFAKRVVLHIAAKVGYAAGKISYRASSALGIDRHARTARRCKAYPPPGFSLDVFLQLPLEEIDAIIRADHVLYNRIMEQGERTIRNEWLVLNARRPEMYDQASGHYRWTEDFFTGYRYPDCFYQDARRQKTTLGTDVKIPWETARMQSLFSLALAYRASGNEKYPEKIKEIIRDFTLCCPCETGVNWHLSMEIGIRLANILLACELVKDSLGMDRPFMQSLAVIVYEHMRHIRRNLENKKDGGNHLLADLLGLSAASAAMRFLPGAGRCARDAQKMLRRELMRQILPDGGDFEGAVSYHRLVGEILCFSVIAQRKIGFSLSKEENERLAAMAGFTAALRMGDGLVPQFGDTDSGRVFQLAPEDTRDHDSFLNLTSYVTDKKLFFTGRPDGFFCFYGLDPEVRPLCPNQGPKEFPASKILCFRQDGLFFALYGTTPEENGKPGHAHNDVLSFVLSLDREEFITDPGSGEYTGNAEIRRITRSVESHATLSADGGEQRLPFSGPEQAFRWDSFVSSSLRTETDENGTVRFIGRCAYKTADGSEIRQTRTVTFSSSLILVEDLLEGMEEECTMALPVFPGIRVTLEDGGVLLTGQERGLRLSGTYEFSVVASVFAKQYKQTVPSETVRCKSRSRKNLLRIEPISL